MYEWAKAFHVLSVIAWMSSLLYLPRLLAYHSESNVNSEKSKTFKVMERRLLKIIANPSMILTLLSGLFILHLVPSFLLAPWFVLKFLLVICMLTYHMFIANQVRKFVNDERLFSTRFYKLINEIPFIIAIFIVILVIVKPF